MFSPLLNPEIPFVAEDEVVARARYVGFAADLYSRLYVEHPTLRGRIRFFRDPRTDDIWSVCDTGACSFGIQLDPDIKVICLWDTNGWFDEIGTWNADPVARAIDEITSPYLRAH